MPGNLSNFDTRNLVTFEDNLKYNGNFPFVVYCDFETTAAKDCNHDPRRSHNCAKKPFLKCLQQK